MTSASGTTEADKDVTKRQVIVQGYCSLRYIYALHPRLREHVCAHIMIHAIVAYVEHSRARWYTRRTRARGAHRRTHARTPARTYICTEAKQALSDHVRSLTRVGTNHSILHLSD